GSRVRVTADRLSRRDAQPKETPTLGVPGNRRRSKRAIPPRAKGFGHQDGPEQGCVRRRDRATSSPRTDRTFGQPRWPQPAEPSRRNRLNRTHSCRRCSSWEFSTGAHRGARLAYPLARCSVRSAERSAELQEDSGKRRENRRPAILEAFASYSRMIERLSAAS